MRSLAKVDLWRDRSNYVFELYGHYGDDREGAFLIPYPLGGMKLRVLASSDLGWDHVSVSIAGDLKATPTWAMMDFVKRLFFAPDEVVMQLHPAEQDHISFHPGTLHLWRPLHTPIPLPPKYMVGPS